MFGNLMDESNSQFMPNLNNSTLGNITNTTINNGLGAAAGATSAQAN